MINVGVLSSALITAAASAEEIGLLMGGIHGLDAHPEPARAGGDGD